MTGSQVNDCEGGVCTNRIGYIYYYTGDLNNFICNVNLFTA